MSRVFAAVLLAGLATLVLVLVLHNGAAPSARPTTTTPAQVPAKSPFTVAREFLETAVARKRMHYAYTLVAPPLKVGISRKQWETGNNQVIPYPARNASTARFTVLRSTKKQLYIQMELRPRLGSSVRAAKFYMDLAKQRAGNWLVDYFESADPYPGGPGPGVP